MGNKLRMAGLTAGLLLFTPQIGAAEDESSPPSPYYQLPVISQLSNEGKGWDLSDTTSTLEGSAYDIGGWVSFGYTSQSDGLFNQHPENFNNHQTWLYFEKAADGSEGLDWGFRFDAMYGIDSRDTQAFGNDPGNFDFLNDDLDRGKSYGFAFPQIYVDLAYKDVSVKAGHFFTPIGYEVVTAPDNFFYSHAFTMYRSEPFTHTGFLASYEGFENVVLHGGWTAGWDSGFDRSRGGSNFLGGASYTPIERATITYLITGGDLGWVGEGYSHSIVVATEPIDKLSYVLQSDYVNTDDDVAGSGYGRYETVGINNYLIYQLFDELGIGLRGEWWKANGVSYFEVTGGFNIKPLPNLTIRPEGRYQASATNDDSKQITGDNPAGLPVDVALFGIDVILTF